MILRPRNFNDSKNTNGEVEIYCLEVISSGSFTTRKDVLVKYSSFR